MTYEEAVAALHESLKFGIEPTLEGVRGLAHVMGDPQNRYACIQVAGTNGKTSTARMTAALLRAEGFHVGLYTSPDLVEYPERFEVDGAVISHESFARHISRVVEAGRTMDRIFTEFELLTAAAFSLFGEEQVDFAVLEVGLGGRWDATSIVNPTVATITGIDYDHMAILGNTLEAIAGEKAAIIKPACCPILGPGTAKVQQVFLDTAASAATFARCVYEVGGSAASGVAADVASGAAGDAASGSATGAADAGAAAVGAAGGLPTGAASPFPSIAPELSCTYTVTQTMDDGDALVLDVRGFHGTYADVALPARPPYQAANVACAIATAEAALGRALDPARVRSALHDVRLPGRFEVVCDDPLVIIDAAHNPEGATVLAQAIRARFHGMKPLLLFAVFADKDVHGILSALDDAVGDIVVTQTSSPRAMPAAELARLVEEQTGRHPYAYGTSDEALCALLGKEGPFSHTGNGTYGTPVVAAGTITLAGAVKGYLGRKDS